MQGGIGKGIKSMELFLLPGCLGQYNHSVFLFQNLDFCFFVSSKTNISAIFLIAWLTTNIGLTKILALW